MSDVGASKLADGVTRTDCDCGNCDLCAERAEVKTRIAALSLDEQTEVMGLLGDANIAFMSVGLRLGIRVFLLDATTERGVA